MKLIGSILRWFASTRNIRTRLCLQAWTKAIRLARGLVELVRDGPYCEVKVKSEENESIRAMLSRDSARDHSSSCREPSPKA